MRNILTGGISSDKRIVSFVLVILFMSTMCVSCATQGQNRALDAANQGKLAMAQAPKNTGAEEDNAVMEWEGQYSSQEEPLVQVVTSERGSGDSLGWRDLWKKASPSSEAPAIDFDKYVVACVFLGRRLTGGYWVEFGKPYIKDNRMVIPYKEHKPTGFVTQALSYPYRMKVFERPAGKEVVLEQIH